jgi:DNA adenine methylase
MDNITEYNNLSKSDLLIKCQELGITKCASKKKSDLIDLIKNIKSLELENKPKKKASKKQMKQDDVEPDNQNKVTHLSPLIKWSGGKSDEIKTFNKHIPEKYNIYLEPFIGGGSVYFYLNPLKSVITDVHVELIDLYNSLKEGKSDDIYKFMEATKNDEETYYKIRDTMEIKTPLDNAKRFYYQRKTCFRGMLRYNKSGKFNIPFGKYKTINYSDLNNKKYEELLKRTEIIKTGFEYVFENYNDENNFMFLDPPYDSEFTDYGYCKFGKEEHIKLAKYFKETKIKCLMIIGKTDFITELYKDYIVEEYQKKYKFKLYAGRIGDEINVKHLIIKNYA